MAENTPATQSDTPTKSPVTDKVLRPILKRKGTTGNSSLLGSARSVAREVIAQDSKPDMAASFLQFCAMCEKQIMTPSNAILYCSEACRRKDSIKPLTAAIITTASISPPPSEPPSPRPLLSPRVPTGVSTPRSSADSLSIPAELHDHTSDLDPTEWKPKLLDRERERSEAFRYLSRFHQQQNHLLHHHQHHHGAASTTDIPSAASSVRASTPTTALLSTPSLTNTPTTTASSSLSTSAGTGMGTGLTRYSSPRSSYDFSYQRPLFPTRQNRWYSFENGGTPKGIDLVTPHVAPPVMHHSGSHSAEELATPTSTGVYDGDGLKWEKRKVMFATTPRGNADGLSVLFAERK